MNLSQDVNVKEVRKERINIQNEGARNFIEATQHQTKVDIIGLFFVKENSGKEK